MTDFTARKSDIEMDGYIAVDDLLDDQDVAWYLSCYDKILSGEIDPGQWRFDLDSGQPKKRDGVENITQVMWPSELIPGLRHQSSLRTRPAHRPATVGRRHGLRLRHADRQSPRHRNADAVPPGHGLLGGPARPASFELLDCLGRGHRGQRLYVVRARFPSTSVAETPLARQAGGALECDGTEAECVCVPLQPGSCTFHNGGVVHYSRGNSTAGHRRALIINFRPAAMIRLEREQGFDHGKTRNVRENRT